ncbi:BA75_01089T0 [Komagataella pastoris]|uniref:BA75_01089T0 n=1 Tax=Komagataella pastoris TaxID=4922 RepID=A0A1B2J582_PICPA|nr:BA75_01089T0 [Komagataella pastoris]
MAKKKNTNESSRRYQFRSFRDHIESIKIEPTLKLSKRSFDYADVSHFLSALNHWRELNATSSFTDLVEEVTPISQTLPQLLYHKDAVFNALERSLETNQALGLQPVLELTAQLCHDLSEDFLEYYERTMKVLRDLAVNQADAACLEWIFDCIAFIFKYLVKYLSQNLIPTFRYLMPLLANDTRRYNVVFASQALSFLIRKAPRHALEDLIEFSFEEPKKMSAFDKTYLEALVIMYSESMKGVSGSLHTKSDQILAVLIAYVVSEPEHNTSTTVLCDTLSDVIRHINTRDQARGLNEFILVQLNEVLDRNEPLATYVHCSLMRILTVLAYTDNGSKVSNWKKFFQTAERVIESASNNDENEFCQLSLNLYAVLLRNCEMSEMTKYYRQLFTKALSFKCNLFLPFIELCLSLNVQKTIALSNAYLQQFITENWRTSTKEITYFIHKISEMDLLSVVADNRGFLNNRFHITFSPELPHDLVSQLCLGDYSDKAVYENVWRLRLLNLTDSKIDPELVHILKKVFNASFKSNSTLSKEMVGLTLKILSRVELNSGAMGHVVKRLLACADSHKTNIHYLEGAAKFLSGLKNEVTLKMLSDNQLILIRSFCTNCSLPYNEVRKSTLRLIIVMLHKLNDTEQTVLLLRKCLLIEEIPLSFESSRDIQLRLRSLASDYLSSPPNYLSDMVVLRFFFGQLTNKFSPSWKVTWELFPKIAAKNPKYAWELAYYFLKDPQNHTAEVEAVDSFDFSRREEEAFDHYNTNRPCTISDTRFAKFLNTSAQFFSSYENISFSLLNALIYTPDDSNGILSMRSQVLKTLTTFPSLPQEHSMDLVPFLFNNLEEDCEMRMENYQAFSVADKALLLDLFAEFPELKSIRHSDRIYFYALKLLTNRDDRSQRLALKCIFAFRNKRIERYRDNLENLIDDASFKDEIFKLVTTNQDNNLLEDRDIDDVIPLVLRILYGKLQTAKGSDSKEGRKNAVLSILPNLQKRHIVYFLSLGHENIDSVSFFCNEKVDTHTVSEKSLKKQIGFVNMLQDVASTLGRPYTEALGCSVKPLVYSLSLAQTLVQSKKDDIKDEFEVRIKKLAKALRQSAMNCLRNFFLVLDPQVFSWDEYFPLIFKFILKDRLFKIIPENSRQASSILKILCLWSGDYYYHYLFTEEFLPLKAVLSLLDTEYLNYQVIKMVLNFVKKMISRVVPDVVYIEAISLIVEAVLKVLAPLLKKIEEPPVITLGIDVLLILVENGYVNDLQIKTQLIEAVTAVLNKQKLQIEQRDRIRVYQTLASLVENNSSTIEEIKPLYQVVSKAYGTETQNGTRVMIGSVFIRLQEEFAELSPIGDLVNSLNAHGPNSDTDVDYPTRLRAFRRINEDLFQNLTQLQWLPIIYNSLYFIDHAEELSLRSNSSFTLKKFIECYSLKETTEAAQPLIQILKAVVLPHLKEGLLNENILVQTEYIGVLRSIVSVSHHFDELNDLKVLIAQTKESSVFNPLQVAEQQESDEEKVDFFNDIVNIQTCCRFSALKKLREHRQDLSVDNLYEYILPVVETVCFSQDEKHEQLATEATNTMAHLSSVLIWSQFKLLIRKHLARLKREPTVDGLRSNINIIVALAKSMFQSVENYRKGNLLLTFREYPTDAELNFFVKRTLLPSMIRRLNVPSVQEDEEQNTALIRVPLSLGMVSAVLCLDEQSMIAELPGVLTGICQQLRCKIESVRDAVREYLGRIAVLLGASYFKFIIKELKGALSRGAHVHILSYTLYHLMVHITKNDHLAHGDMDDCAQLIIDIIMEDTFGLTGHEKDADAYISRTKEVKEKMSFETAEILARNISLKHFSVLIQPVKFILRERLSSKMRTKLTQLMHRFSVGLSHNAEANTAQILILCYELYHQAQSYVEEKETRKRKSKRNVEGSSAHFLVQLDSRPLKTLNEYSQYVGTLEKFAFDILGNVLIEHQDLLTVGNLSTFLPMLESSLCESDDDEVVASNLRIMILLAQLPFPADKNPIFQRYTTQVLKILRECPNTGSELCQASLKYLSRVIEFKSQIELTNEDISYILLQIHPDLAEPPRQELAFEFLKSLVSQHVMLPEIYEIMNEIAEIMITNHNKLTRKLSLEVYLQFLMEYDQSRGRLEKQFMMLVDNLDYPVETGRQSVMELLHHVVQSSDIGLISKLSSSFFVSLINVSIADDSSKCREMASLLISQILKILYEHSSSELLLKIIKYGKAWTNHETTILQRCGLHTYKLLIQQTGVGYDTEFDALILQTCHKVFVSASAGSTAIIEWELLFYCLNTFASILEHHGELELNDARLLTIWKGLIGILLFPHGWIRLLASRIIGSLIEHTAVFMTVFDQYEAQTIALRLLHQLDAPEISEKLGEQVVRNLSNLSVHWNSSNSKCLQREESKDCRYDTILEWALSRVCTIVRQDSRALQAKKAGIQYFAVIIQLVSPDKLRLLYAKQIILALYPFIEREYHDGGKIELEQLAEECVSMLNSKLGTSTFTELFVEVQTIVLQRRAERKARWKEIQDTKPEEAQQLRAIRHEKKRYRAKRKAVDATLANEFFRDDKRTRKM